MRDGARSEREIELETELKSERDAHATIAAEKKAREQRINELEDELRKLKPQERVQYVKDQLNKRLAVQKEITELSKKRDEYVKEEMKKNAKKGDKAFDEAVRSSLREQPGAPSGRA